MVYLDHNASSPLLPIARDAWLDAEERFPGNPSSPHRVGARGESALDQARQRLAVLLGCSPLDLVWTSGATESCNTVLQHAAGSAGPGATVWISAIEHPAVAQAARFHFPGRVESLPVDARGVVRLDEGEARFSRGKPALVAVMAANNETGALQPWREWMQWCAERGVPFFCDATQWLGRLPAAELGSCAFVAGSAHKFGGPRGTGFLKVPAGSALQPLLRGGKQQDGRRAGTENVAAVIAMLAALEWCGQQIAARAHEARLAVRERFERELARALPGVRVNGPDGGERLWNTVNVTMPAADCRHLWVVKLDKAGFAVSTGSACASGSEQPSAVLTAMGLTAAETSRALRFSSGWMTREADWDALLQALVRISGEIGSAAGNANRP